VLAYGPGQFDAGFQRIDFKLHSDGHVQACLLFAVNRPERILNLSLNPLSWSVLGAEVLSLGTLSPALAPFRRALGSSDRATGIDPVFGFITLANLMTGGLAARDLCISRERMETDFLIQHFMQHYEVISGSLVTWRSVGDWLDQASLPAWVVEGRLR
jgi:hypothetical protein